MIFGLYKDIKKAVDEQAYEKPSIWTS